MASWIAGVIGLLEYFENATLLDVAIDWAMFFAGVLAGRWGERSASEGDDA